MAASGLFAFRETIADSNDFSELWEAVRLFALGYDPYVPADWVRHGELTGVTRNTDTRVTSYLPWANAILLPLGFLELPVASRIWTFGTFALASFSLGSLLTRVRPLSSSIYVGLGFVLASSYPSALTFYSGQWGFITLAGMCWYLRGVVSNTHPINGLGALIFMVKPQAHIGVAFALGVYSLVKRRSQLTVAVLAGILTIITSLLVATPHLLAWIKYVPLARTSGGEIGRRIPTLGNVFSDGIGPIGWWLGLVITLSLVAFSLWRYWPKTVASLSVWFPLSALATVYIHGYDYVYLIGGIVLGLDALKDAAPWRLRLYTVGSCLALTLGGYLLAAIGIERVSGSTDVFLPLTLWLLAVLCVRPTN